jgi:hypothetical protein
MSEDGLSDDGRKFRAGMGGVLDGIKFRCAPSTLPNRLPGIVLQWKVRPDLDDDDDAAWRAIHAHTIGVMVEAIYENERVIMADIADQLPVPPGEYFLQFLRRCIEVGSRQADDEWREARADKLQRAGLDESFIAAIERANDPDVQPGDDLLNQAADAGVLDLGDDDLIEGEE